MKTESEGKIKSLPLCRPLSTFTLCQPSNFHVLHQPGVRPLRPLQQSPACPGSPARTTGAHQALLGLQAPRPQTSPEYSGMPPWSSPNRSSLFSRTSRARASDGDPPSTSSSASSLSPPSQLSSTSLLLCPGNLPACVWDHPPLSAPPPSPCLPLRLSSHWSDAKVFLPIICALIVLMGRQAGLRHPVHSHQRHNIHFSLEATDHADKSTKMTVVVTLWILTSYLMLQVPSVLRWTILSHHHLVESNPWQFEASSSNYNIENISWLRPGVFSPSSLFGIDWQRYLMLKMTRECPLFRSNS